MMRVAFITNLCPHYRRPLFESLASRFDIDFYFHSGGTERFLSREMTSQEGAFHVEDTRRLTLAGHQFLPGLAKRLNKSRYEAVVKSLDGRLMVPYVYGLTRLRRIPLVLWTGMWYHPQTPAHQATKTLTEAVYRGAESIVAYGDHVKHALTSVRGVDSAKVFVAGQAIEATRLLEIRPAQREPIILYVGQLEQRKGLDYLLEAFKRMADPSARLRIVGSGPLQPQLNAARAADPRIELVGYMPNDDLVEELARARCLVLPSVTTRRDREPWGLVINEAFAAGIPVAVTDAVGAAAGGLVREGRNGYVVPERDAESLAAALQRLVTDAKLASTLGSRAREDVRHFTYDRMVRAFSDALEHAVQRAV